MHIPTPRGECPACGNWVDMKLSDLILDRTGQDYWVCESCKLPITRDEFYNVVEEPDLDD